MKTQNRQLEQDGVRDEGSDVQRVHFGPVHLSVTDLDRSVGFWQGTLGMIRRTTQVDGGVALGSVDRTLVVLRPGARLPQMRGYAGLYHLALHLASESSFVFMIERLRGQAQPFSPVDHLLSKSIYLADPDGIGLEFTLETPQHGKFLGIDSGGFPHLIDRQGRRHSAREALDIAGMRSRQLSPTPIWDRPDAVKVGHIHLTVPDLTSVRDHYLSEGFELSFDARAIGMVEMHTGGIFRHQLVLNNWQGAEAGRPASDMAGLNHFTLIEADMSTDNSQTMREDPAGNLYKHFTS